MVSSTHKHQLKKATALAARLRLPFVEKDKNSYKYHLVYTDKRLELQLNPDFQKQKIKPLSIEYIKDNFLCSRLATATVRDPLARAIGIKANYRPTVMDVTAGLGMDAMSLAFMGCRVILIERSPIIHALLSDALERVKDSPILGDIVCNNIELVHCNSITYLLNSPTTCESILVDPMYPPTRKTALHKKEMQLLKEIVGNDVDSDRLFKHALEVCQKRVVVKRPKGAEKICRSPEPSYQVNMKSGRFDIYIKPHL